jgi:hypothetical protein
VGKNHFAIKESDGKEEKRFVTNELPLKITSQYTLIKSESISNGRKIYVLCCCFSFLRAISMGVKGTRKCGNYAEKLVKNLFFTFGLYLQWGKEIKEQ